MFKSTIAKIKTRILQAPRWLLALAAVVVVLTVLLLTRGKTVNPGSTFTARRGPLPIMVLVGGNTEALESQDIKCEVKGYQGVKILKIVEEGYQVTDDDVRTNKVLVELDSSELRKMIVQKEIDFQTAEASLTEARQSYEIQLNQNASDVLAAEQKAKFARMDFEKFLGDKATQELIDQIEAPEKPMQKAAVVPEETNRPPVIEFVNLPNPEGPRNVVTAIGENVEGSLPPSVAPATAQKADLKGLAAGPGAVPGGSASAPLEAPKRISIDFTKYASIELLGDGESKQKIRKFDDDLQIAQKEFSQAKTALEGTTRLHEKGFATKTELETDAVKFDNARLKVQTAETARALFLKYEFPKSAEEFMSKYIETTHELDRARKAALSKLAQAQAKLRSAEGRYNLEIRQRKDFEEQLGKCTIMAKKPGLVVYGGGNMMYYYYGGQEQIREGALVREQQPIITIPDMSHMAVKVRIHESYIKKVTKGQKARITLDAFPDKPLEGEVTKVSPLPDSQNRYMNPDMNVYLTTINVTGQHDGLKPGMSAKVEIRVNELPDVIYVPIQAVTPLDKKQICYVLARGVQEKREVQIGEFNDEFIEIKKGIKEGEKICLRAPDSLEKEEARDAGPKSDSKPATANAPGKSPAATSK
jgi:multidrug efflux pump subunit AcrA (membrane-fusion protein)